MSIVLIYKIKTRISCLEKIDSGISVLILTTLIMVGILFVGGMAHPVTSYRFIEIMTF